LRLGANAVARSIACAKVSGAAATGIALIKPTNANAQPIGRGRHEGRMVMGNPES
jgi:hypothetical protein